MEDTSGGDLRFVVSLLPSPLTSFRRIASAEPVLTGPCLSADPDAPKKRKKKNRWGDQTDNKAAGLMGLPTAIFATMTSEQLEAYALHLRIEEISQKLRINDCVPAEGDRSVSSLSSCLASCTLTNIN